MSTLTVLPSGKSFEVAEGTTLLAALLGAEIGERLDTIVGIGSKSRLACQAKILGTENVTIELLGFGSGV